MFDDQHPEPAEERGGPEEILDRDETVRLAHEAIAQLSEAQREVVVMHYLQGWRIEEMATTLRVAEGTVKSRLGRAHWAAKWSEDLPD